MLTKASAISAILLHMLLMLLTGAFIWALPAGAVSVRPLVVDIDATPGETVGFQLSLIPGDKPETVNLELYKPTQTLDGNLSYEKTDATTLPVIGWITLPSQVRLSPGEEAEVAGSVKIPLNAGGSYIVTVMVEPVQDVATGIALIVRYAVRLNIRVSRPGIRPGVNVTAFDILRAEDGEPSIQCQVKNTSALDFLTSAEVTVRNSHRRLVDTVELKPAVGWSSNLAETRLYPLSEVRYTGRPAEPLLPGQYELKLFYRYGSGSQVVKSEIIEVKEGDFTYPPFRLKVLKASPPELEYEGKPGAMASKALRFETRSSEAINVVLEAVEVQADYPYSIFANTDLELKGSAAFTLNPGRVVTSVLTARFPKDAKVQGNYGFLRAKVVGPEDKVLEETLIPLSAVVSGNVSGGYRKTAEATNISAEKEDKGYLLSVAIRNTGNIRLTPTAMALVKDSEGRLIETAKLAIEKDAASKVLPGRNATLAGSLSNARPGAYNVEIKLYEDATPLGTSVLPVALE